VNAELLEKLLNESECTYLDFKQAQYPFVNASDEAKSELLKDILALANADKSGAGYILIGVVENRGSRSKILGITNHLNDHELQQFVASKINRPLKFSYEAVPCDGVSIGVLHIPVQERYFFLKNDYGKLGKNLVYYRLGSSTREATPDEIIRWGQQAAVKDSEPSFELQFALIKRPTAIGGSQLTKEVGTSLSVRTRYTDPVSGVELAKLCPDPQKLGFVREAEYWMDFAKFLRSALLFTPIGLALKNVGGTTALDVRIATGVKRPAVGFAAARDERAFPNFPCRLAVHRCCDSPSRRCLRPVTRPRRPRSAFTNLPVFHALPPAFHFGATGRRDETPGAREGSANHRNAVLLELFIGRHHRQVMQRGRSDNKTVARIVVNGRQSGSGNAHVQCERQNRQTMMLDGFFKPFLGRARQFQFFFGGLDRDFKATDGGNINGRSCVDFFQGRTAQFFTAAGEPEQGAGVQNHRAASGHSSAESGSTGSYPILILPRTGCVLIRLTRWCGTRSATGSPLRQMTMVSLSASSLASRLEKLVFAS
jgi:hypothetical protein